MAAFNSPAEVNSPPPRRESLTSPSAWRAWLLGWLGASLLAMLNGSLRRAVYEDRLGRMRAHYLSTSILLLAVVLYMRWLDSRWPSTSERQAWAIGASWLAATVVFEFGLGRLTGSSWADLLAQYDLRRGYVWVLVPLWTLVGPPVTWRLCSR